MFKRVAVIIVVLFECCNATCQTLGGNAVFNFIQLPNTPQVSAVGGINISTITNDVGIAYHNPAMLRSDMNGSVGASFNAFVGDINNYSVIAAYSSNKLNTNFDIAINYFDYGRLSQTDAIGNVMGTFKSADYVMQLSASRRYKENWFYGTSVKFINSSYGVYKSNGIAADVGVTYYDSSRQLQASIVVKNIGWQLKTSGTSYKEELPFDLQAGITKRLEKAPLQFSLTAHNLQQFNTYYNDTSFLASEGQDNFRGKNFTINKLLEHFVAAAQFFIRDKVEISTGYNFLRRKDLNVFNATNGLNGFTIGGGLLLKYLQVRYATGFYQQNIFNQIGINFKW